MLWHDPDLRYQLQEPSYISFNPFFVLKNRIMNLPAASYRELQVKKAEIKEVKDT
jgi:hypothetical protein